MGNAFLKPLIARDKNNEFSAGSVTFEPGARTNWHTHPKGQVLLIIEGEGFYQEKGKPAQIIRKGDVVNIPENVVHWHDVQSKLKCGVRMFSTHLRRYYTKKMSIYCSSLIIYFYN